jgi:hypothetical protein
MLENRAFVYKLETSFFFFFFLISQKDFIKKRKIYYVGNKLKSLKMDLKKWNDEVFGDIGRKKELLEGIQELDVLAKTKGLVQEEKLKKADMSKELENNLLCEKIHWHQKLRALW